MNIPNTVSNPATECEPAANWSHLRSFYVVSSGLQIVHDTKTDLLLFLTVFQEPFGSPYVGVLTPHGFMSDE